jgi:hypothetical protein
MSWKAGEDVEGQVEFEAEWLGGYVDNGGVMVYSEGE